MTSYPQSHPKHCEDNTCPPHWAIDNDQAAKLDEIDVKHPSHYTYGTIEAKDYINSCGFGEGFNLGNALKYITRCNHKGNKIKDLEKAIEYLQFEIERERKLRE